MPMKFFDEMLTKSGFNGGEAVPDHIELYRTVYIRIINAMAVKANCKQRIVAFDRWNRNPYIVIFHQLEDLEKHGIKPEDYEKHTEIPLEAEDADALMELVLQAAHDMYPDQFLETKTTILEGAVEEFVKDVNAGRWQEYLEAPEFWEESDIALVNGMPWGNEDGE